MAARFVNIDRSTPMFLPPDLRDWVPQDHLVHFVLDAAEALPLNQFRINHRGTGSEQYPPRVLLALLIDCYATGTFPSRQIETRTHLDDNGIATRTFPHHTETPNVLAFRPRAANPETSDPSVCASGSDDRTVRIWQPGRERMVRIIRKHQGPILCLAWMPDGSSLFSAGTEGTFVAKGR